jgi:hypothetical protein
MILGNGEKEKDFSGDIAPTAVCSVEQLDFIFFADKQRFNENDAVS